MNTTDFDNLIIRHCKSCRSRYKILARIVAKYCAIDAEYIAPGDVLMHLLTLIEKFNLSDAKSLVLASHPSNKWKYGLNTDGIEDQFVAGAMAACCSVIGLTEVKKLPGYRGQGKVLRRLNK